MEYDKENLIYDDVDTKSIRDTCKSIRKDVDEKMKLKDLKDKYKQFIEKNEAIFDITVKTKDLKMLWMMLDTIEKLQKKQTSFEDANLDIGCKLFNVEKPVPQK
jgi:hypothetical protein